MSKNFHSLRNAKQTFQHGAQNGMGPFRQWPKKCKPIKPQRPAGADTVQSEVKAVVTNEQAEK